MNLLRVDSVGGASGDMSLSLLADLGADLDTISDQIRQADPGTFRILAEKTEDKGISGTRVKVEVEEQHHHRHLPDILDIIKRSGLTDDAKELAKNTFIRLADAEGKVHGISRDEVHFHEVGALDSVVDILGACAGLCMLKIDAVEVGTLPTGTGTIECAHGVMPVPVPATAELLIGHPVLSSGEKGEMITPTGAALLMQWKELTPNHKASMTVTGVGYGLGHREMNRPNVLRGLLLTDEELPSLDDECMELQTNLDDMTPEQAGWIQKRLLKTGALDVLCAPVMMKKQRPGMLLTVLCKPAQSETIKEIIFKESTSLGIRETFKIRTILKRTIVDVETDYGVVRVKTGSLDGKLTTRSPEYEDCAKLASEKNVPFKLVYESASREFDKLQ
jgi:uncharacterized protein (TIGR00299 family) protein